MKVLSIDIETTGLDVVNDQILQFSGVVYDTKDFVTRFEDMPHFTFNLKHPRLTGDLYAIVLNAKLLEQILHKTSPYKTYDVINPDDYVELHKEFEMFLRKNFPDHCSSKGIKIPVIGKNAAGFDVVFLKQINFDRYFSHRVLDVGGFYLEDDDKFPPDLQTCLKRANLEGTVSHCAKDDAIDVLRVFREHLISKKDKK
jgi:oligoribonuclease (3'-5' exoribonuclease)